MGRNFKFMKLPPRSRILLVRPDKIGDLILTIPALLSLREAYPEAHIAFLCRAYAAPILQNNPALNSILTVDRPFGELVGMLKGERFDAAVHFYAEAKSIFATFRASIPVRVGPMSKISSLLLTHRISQNRSRVEMHEAEYNLQLAGLLGANIQKKNPVIFLTEEEKRKGKELLSTVFGKSDPTTVLMHPGSAGSAKNWPLDSYMELAQRIAGELGEVLITTGPGEESIAETAKALKNPGIRVYSGRKDDLRSLAALISASKLAVSNSTGPLHMAAALGIPTCSFYPRTPIVTSAKRWGPYGDPALHQVLVPADDSAPMASIRVEEALEAVRKRLK